MARRVVGRGLLLLAVEVERDGGYGKRVGLKGQLAGRGQRFLVGKMQETRLGRAGVGWKGDRGVGSV